MQPTNVLTPSALNRLVRELLEDALPMVWLEGEVSNFMRASSGHWYFSLKDAAAEVRCAMFARSNLQVRAQPGNGSKVLVRARVSLYEARGSFQLIVEELEDAGEGALRRAFEQLKAKLQAEGLFDAARKRPLPPFPRRLGVVTSARGAAVRDVLAVARRRFALTAIEILPVLVQGAEAPAQIAAMLRAAAAARRYDVLLVTRGGGSLEDLAAFNDEGVARAIAASTIPVVSAVGHEVDFSISDFVADMRAPTPSAAAELILPDGDALARTLTESAQRLQLAWRRRGQQAGQRLDQLAARLQAQRPRQRLGVMAERLAGLARRLTRAQALAGERATTRLDASASRLYAQDPRVLLQRLTEQQADLQRRLAAAWSQAHATATQRLAGAGRALQVASPLAVLERGYAILFDPDGATLRSSQAVQPGDAIRARLADGELALRVETSPSR